MITGFMSDSLSLFMKSQRGLGLFPLIFCIVVIAGFLAFSAYVIHIDSVIRKKFEGQRWDIPAKVYARPLEIYNRGLWMNLIFYKS
jgi:penicillin-binding protein 1B